MTHTKYENNVFYHGDCFDIMKLIPDNKVDAIISDLPYGTTQNKWDSVLPFEELWQSYWRVLKPDGVVVLTAAQPFTSALVMSQVKYFKYDWTWRKPKGTGHLNAKKMPMKDKEDILVFCKGKATYNPQFSKGTPYKNKAGKVLENGLTDNYGHFGISREGSPNGNRYPKQVLEFGVVERGNLHPTQKPTPLFEYLIKTYTNEGEVVLDNCAGSGTTAIAAINTNRNWVCIEKDETYYNTAIERINFRLSE
jgi:site-specific DNA-methyltransferase (adenine-specific)